MIQRNEDGSVTLTKEQYAELQRGHNFVYDDYLRSQRETMQTKKTQEPRLVTLQCKDESPSFDRELRIVTIVDEDDDMYYANNGIQYPKYAWRLTHEEAKAPTANIEYHVNPTKKERKRKPRKP